MLPRSFENATFFEVSRFLPSEATRHGLIEPTSVKAVLHRRSTEGAIAKAKAYLCLDVPISFPVLGCELDDIWR